jgi:UPF0052 protein yvcK
MNKKIVIIGGGTGLSYLIRKLKEFPVQISAIITVADDGSSTGKLREEFSIPAVGDIRQVLYNMSTLPKETKDILEYRFKTYSDLNGHALGNLMLAAFYNKTNSLQDSISYMSKLFDINHKVLPISEDYLTLLAEDENGNVIEGEDNIGHTKNQIKKIYYKEKVKINKNVLQEIKEADLIVFSMGSLYTSLLPNLIVPELQKAIKMSDAKVLYVCNAVNEPGETKNYKVSDFLKTIEKHLGFKRLDAVIIGDNKTVSKEMLNRYLKEEGKELVKLDRKEVEKMGVEILNENIITTVDGTIKHDSFKLALVIFNYLMR